MTPDLADTHGQPETEFKVAGSPETDIIYAVTEYQLVAESWGWGEVIKTLLLWKEYLVEEFKLQVPELAFCIDKLPVRTMGYYRGEYNGFGLKREIALNSKYIQKGDQTTKFDESATFYDVIGTLAHELIHAHQDTTGTSAEKRNHHNEEFRAIAEGMGLIVNAEGEQTYVPNGRFFEFLKCFEPNIKLPDMSNGEPVPQTKKKKGKSTLKKWGCDCQSTRSGKGELFFVCSKPGGCGKPVRLLEDEPNTVPQNRFCSEKPVGFEREIMLSIA